MSRTARGQLSRAHAMYSSDVEGLESTTQHDTGVTRGQCNGGLHTALFETLGLDQRGHAHSDPNDPYGRQRASYGHDGAASARLGVDEGLALCSGGVIQWNSQVIELGNGGFGGGSKLTSGHQNADGSQDHG